MAANLSEREGGLVGCDWEASLVSSGRINGFVGAAYYGSCLLVFVSALAFEAGDFAVFE